MFSNLYKQYKESHNEYFENIKKEKTFIKKFQKMLPNILTTSRFIAPFIIVPIALSNLSTAFIITIIFALTDAFDGYFARKYNAHSEYGRILDTICDKVFAVGITIPILIINPIMIITIILETVITAINLHSANKNNNPKSTYLGKFKTCILSLNLILNYLNFINIPIILFTNIIQLITAIDYYKIDKKKDKEKNIKLEHYKENQIIENNDIERQKNELLELKKSLLPEEELIIQNKIKNYTINKKM